MAAASVEIIRISTTELAPAEISGFQGSASILSHV
jgi:hypothetical protein